METKTINEELIARYLLGDLSEQELMAVEDRAFSDRSYLEEILSVESDLIDEYVRGELSHSERQLFETRFLTSAERRNKIEFARALATISPVVLTEKAETERQPFPSRAQSRSFGRALSEFIASLNPLAQFAMASAGLIIIAGGSWLAFETLKLRTEVASLRAEQLARVNEKQALEQQISLERSRSHDLAAQIERERQKSEGNNTGIGRVEVGQPPKPRSESIIATLLLAPGIGRSSGDRPRLVVPTGSGLVSLRIGLEPGEQYKTFRVEVRTRAGMEIAAQGGLPPRQSREGRTVTLNIPASKLAKGEYELTLKGESASAQV